MSILANLPFGYIIRKGGAHHVEGLRVQVQNIPDEIAKDPDCQDDRLFALRLQLFLIEVGRDVQRDRKRALLRLLFERTFVVKTGV